MKVFKKTKSGFIETLYTQGSYKPKGWSLTELAAKRKK